MTSAVVKSIDPVSGSVDWIEDDDFDLHQEIARSTYADMIHDHERNEKYYLALEKAIKKMKKSGRKANVLDIGTGTGLLSMMAARLGADSIVACEAFAPMYKCAKEIIKANGFADRIHVVSKHSKYITVGPEGDMKCRANILVTEVFDSDFIGEGALLTFRHALEELLEEDSIVVPSSGRVFAQVIESEMVRRWNKLDDIVVSDNNVLKVPNTLERCPGTYSVHDLQLSQFPVDQFKTVFEPHVIFSFDFLGKTKLEFNRHNETNGVASITGNAHAVFMWWELTMDIDDEIILSCAPYWAHPSPEAKNGPDGIPWRDHWMQEIYYLPKDVPVTKGQNLKLISNHDEFGFWFNLFPYIDKNTDKDDTEDCIRPACTCNLHLICSYTRIGMLNDPLRRGKYLSALKQKINSESVVLSIGDCSLLGLMAVSLGAKMVYCEDVSMFARPIISEFIKINNLSDKIHLLAVKYDNIGNVKKTDELLQIIKKVDLIITEPFFSSAFLPWHHLRWKPSECLEKCLVFPNEAIIWAVAVQFDHLYKIRAPLNKVFDFSMTECDELISNASVVSDSPIELQPLWEYGTVSLSRPFKLFQLNLNSDYPEKDKHFQSTVNIEASGRLDAIVLWIEHKLDDDISVSNGIITDVTSVKPGEKIKWDMYTRQAVCFAKQYYPLMVSQSDELSIDAIFQCKNSDLLLNTNLRCANGDVYTDVTGKPSSKFSYLMNEGNN